MRVKLIFVCGKEIVGEALRVGSKVTLVKPGQRVGVGAQSYSCLDCRQCANDNETYCKSLCSFHSRNIHSLFAEFRIHN